ncbi:unnamed protein product [Peronospora belbahrii]|uniref:FHA domain-containing protein n=1 Tax=Peronospora belbahrii TaxID=622444 RepID=A0ABN8D1H6_9STRA|nr:unnamed protein product [Peronospora belbahrii]
MTQEELRSGIAKPWGRFLLVSKKITDDHDHIYFINQVTTIGRNKRRCDLVINKLFISSVHCVVRLDGTDETGKPIVKLDDNSRNGIWVNANRVGKGVSMQLNSGCTVHFTKPGTTPAGVTPMAYKFEFLDVDDSLPVFLEQGEVNEVIEDIDMTAVADKSFEATQLTAPADPSSPSEKKRKRMDADSVAVSVATQELESELEATKRQLMIAGSQLKAAEAQLEQKKGLKETVQTQVNNIAKENVDLIVKMEAITAENLQLKAELAAKDKAMEVKVKEATTKGLEVVSEENDKLKEKAIMKEKAMELKIKQSFAKLFEADCEAKSQEMAAKLQEATKKYQHKVEAENYEQRREMSEQIAVLTNENEKLQTIVDKKNEELAEYGDGIARLRDKITALEETNTLLTAKGKSIAELEEKIADLEEKLTVSKDESAEIVGLLAAAEEKIVAAENKAAKAEIAAAASARANANNTADASERHELQKSISSLRRELETYHTQLTSRRDEYQAATIMSMATAPLVSSATKSIAQGEDSEALRARLATALNLFSQVQALGLQGASLATMTNNSSELGDLHLLSAASAESKRNSTRVLKASSSLPTEDDQHIAQDDANGSSKEKTAKQFAERAGMDNVGKVDGVECMVENIHETAESKLSSPYLKQVTLLSGAIEANAASAIAAMASAEDNEKRSPNTGVCVTALRAQRRISACVMRSFASYPPHEVVGLPSLSPTMETGNMSKWNKKEGDAISSGDIVCEIETDKAVVDYEATDDMFLAKILIPEGTENVPVGQPMMVVCEDEESIAAFKNFIVENVPATPAPPVLSEEQVPPKKEDVSVSTKAQHSMIPQDSMVNLQNTEKNVTTPAIPAAPVTKAATKAAPPTPAANAMFGEKWGLGIKNSAIATSVIKKQQAYIALYGITGMTPPKLLSKK